jgi:hypothetical protein
MTTSNKILTLIDEGPITTSSSNIISDFTDIQGGIANTTSNKIDFVWLRSFDPGSKVRVKSLTATAPLPTFSSTVAGLPDASDLYGYCVYVTDETGGAVLAFSDGLSWRRWTDREIVS